MAAKVAELRAEGDRHFLSKAFGKALESYEQAIKQLGDAPGKAALLLPSAGCYLQEKRWAHADRAGSALPNQHTQHEPRLRHALEATAHS